jgi:hypothetical protein
MGMPLNSVEELVVPEKRHVSEIAWRDEAIKNEVAIRRIVLFIIGYPLWFTIKADAPSFEKIRSVCQVLNPSISIWRSQLRCRLRPNGSASEIIDATPSDRSNGSARRFSRTSSRRYRIPVKWEDIGGSEILECHLERLRNSKTPFERRTVANRSTSNPFL